MYIIKEIFYTLQGEGARTGRPAIFCRFSGCNLWSGQEKDRTQAVCQYCDTDFVGTNGENGGQYDVDALAAAVNQLWPADFPENKYVVFTGGEPLLQLNAPLINAMHAYGFEVAIETNGTISIPAGIDWVCVSPKANATLSVKEGDELKVIVPQEGIDLFNFESLAFSHFYLQPLDNDNNRANLDWAIECCLRNPKWKLSLQTHKYLQIP